MNAPHNRRAADSDNNARLKADLMELVTEVEDMGMRVVLSMMVRMLDSQTNLKAEILSAMDEKLIALRADIRKDVLNGHADVHYDHHEWIADVQRQAFEPVFALAKQRHENGGYCDYAARMLAAEAEAEELKKKQAEHEGQKKTDLKYSMIEKVVLVVGGATLASVAPHQAKAIGL